MAHLLCRTVRSSTVVCDVSPYTPFSQQDTPFETFDEIVGGFARTILLDAVDLIPSNHLLKTEPIR